LYAEIKKAPPIKGVKILAASVDSFRSRGLPARVQIQTKIVLVVERGLEARGYEAGPFPA
jgi:hypothetical protein